MHEFTVRPKGSHFWPETLKSGWVLICFLNCLHGKDDGMYNNTSFDYKEIK